MEKNQENVANSPKEGGTRTTHYKQFGSFKYCPHQEGILTNKYLQFYFFNSRGINMNTIMNKSIHVHGKPKYCLTCGVAGWLSERQASPATSCPFVCLSLRSTSAVEASTAFVLSSQHLPSGIRSSSRCLVHFSVYSASALQALLVSM